jgi:hypothetical protein
MKNILEATNKKKEKNMDDRKFLTSINVLSLSEK